MINGWRITLTILWRLSMTYRYGLEPAPDNMTDYLNKMFERGEYSKAKNSRETIYQKQIKK